MDLAYHDISRTRGLYYLLERAGQVDRVAHEPRVFEAKNVPPQTTRARLRGEFIRRAQEKRRDFTVDWVHLKLNDQAQRTVLCKDPFKAVDDRVDKLIAHAIVEQRRLSVARTAGGLLAAAAYSAASRVHRTRRSAA